jgi:O-antigen/teichoic acid export membrane protein
VSRAGELLSLIRLRSFEVDTEGGRSRERYRRAGWTAVAAVAAKLVSVAAVLVTVPLTLGYLGSEQYGMWMTISSIALMLAFADLGIGNGVLNLIADAHGREDREMAKEAVSSGLFLLSLVGVACVAVFALVYTFVPWARVYNVTSAAAMAEAGPATAVFVVVLAINIPLGVFQRIQLGYQRGFVNYAWQAAGSVFALGGAIVAVEMQASLPWLVLALTGGPLLAVALNGAVELGWVRPWLRPAWGFVQRAVARRIFGLGLWFFLIQLGMTVGYATDYFVIAQVLGSAQVTQYAVPARLFSFIGVIVAMLVAPLWPAYGEAMAKGDVRWVRRTLARTLWVTLVLTAVPAAVLVVFGPQIVHLWVGDTVTPSYTLLAGMALFSLLSGIGATIAIFLNGASLLRVQAVCTIVMSVVALGLKILFAEKWGVEGVPWAMVLAYGLFVAVPFAWYVPRVVRRLGGAPHVIG